MKDHIAIVAKQNHPLAAGLITELLKHFKAKKFSYLYDQETFEAYEKTFIASNAPKEAIRPRNDIWKEAKLIIVLGGDGTLISVCRHIRDSTTSVLGVNLGTLGFLTEISPEETIECLDNFLKDQSLCDSRPLLEIAIDHSHKHEKMYALNDVVFNKQALARIFPLNVRVNEEEATSIRGDGLIVSTPSGSTAYSLAAGGSIVHPSVDALLLTPICPHSLSARPLIITGKDAVHITLGEDCNAEAVFLTVDGQEGLSMCEGMQVTISKSNYSVRFVKSKNKGYFSNLKAKLRWGT